MRARASLLAAMLCAVACKGREQVELRYHLDGLSPSDVRRVVTMVTPAPSESRQFDADQPYHSVAQGVGYEVRDFDGVGKRALQLSFDASLGYAFKSDFVFVLLPPSAESAPRIALKSRAEGPIADISSVTASEASFGRGVIIDITLKDVRCGGTTACASDQMCCTNMCVRTSNDPKNCGMCGAGCAPKGDGCSGADCRCAGGSACTGAQSCCSGLGCVDTSSDPFHCGGCANACHPGEACVNGACVCGRGAACGGANPVCCGSGATATCSTDGTCACGGGNKCVAPQVCCNGASCVDLANDNNNCGKCGNVCTSPLACMGGACKCSGIICAASDACCPTGCANLATDPNNCGACGNQCNPGERCGTQNGAPACLCGNAVCGSNQICCGNTCVPVDASNCGACGHQCRPGETCSGGACTCNGQSACLGNQVCCAAAAGAPGGCFDTANGPEHCGGCDQGPCPPKQMCVQGQCVPTKCSTPCTHGNQCNGGVCACNGGTACRANTFCCASGCVDLSSDLKNCGVCGQACTDPLCCNGTCTPYGNNNCGMCGPCPTGSFCCMHLLSAPSCLANGSLCL